MAAAVIDRDAARRAGYADVDTPCEPYRAWYTDDAAGDAAFGRAVGRWTAYLAFAADNAQSS